jgi:hypothetical protein
VTASTGAYVRGPLALLAALLLLLLCAAGASAETTYVCDTQRLGGPPAGAREVVVYDFGVTTFKFDDGWSSSACEADVKVQWIRDPPQTSSIDAEGAEAAGLPANQESFRCAALHLAGA